MRLIGNKYISAIAYRNKRNKRKQGEKEIKT